MYEDGADVVYSAAGGSGLGVFAAASEAGSPGEVWAIGVDSDQYELVGEDLQPYILTSMLKKVDVAVYETIRATPRATSRPASRTFDLESGGVDYSASAASSTTSASRSTSSLSRSSTGDRGPDSSRVS
jgi:basic membrane protein A